MKDIIAAVQWDGSNLGEMKKFLGDRLIVEPKYSTFLTSISLYGYDLAITSSRGDIVINKGDYVLQDCQGNYYIREMDKGTIEYHNYAV